MDSRRQLEINELFEAALEQPPAERGAFVTERAAGDPELEAGVLRLLAADQEAGAFLERPAIELAGLAPRSPAAIGRYEVLERIGGGGFGEVFRARDPALKRLVAIKTCRFSSPELCERFAREAEIAARLDHPNVTVVYDVGAIADPRLGTVPYLVQELLAGEDLSRVIAAERPMPLARRLDVLIQVARGLAYAHQRGVVHRDVKPGNVRLLPDGRVKIMDFGIARLAAGESQLTQTGALMGTVAYMAPEQIEGRASGARSDVFSFGVLAYELLTHRCPFDGETGAAVMYAVLERDPEPLTALWPECPPRLAAIVERCLTKDPAGRYPSAGALAADLEAVAAALDPAFAKASFEPSESPTVLLRPAAREAARARRWLAVTAALLGAAVLAALPFVLRRAPPEPPAAAPAVAPGLLRIDARPWAEVVRLTDAAGRDAPLPGQRFTPLAIALPPGRWVVELSNPRSAATRRCAVEVPAGASVACRAEFARVDAAAFVEKLGF